MVEYDPYDYQVHEDPYPVYRALREEAPVYRNQALGFWALSRHADVLAAFKDVETFSSRHGVSLDQESSTPTPTHHVVLAMDPPRTRACARWSRAASRRVGSRRGAADWASRASTVRCAGAAAAISRGLAGKLPIDVIIELLGSRADRPGSRLADGRSREEVQRGSAAAARRRCGCPVLPI